LMNMTSIIGKEMIRKVRDREKVPPAKFFISWR
jgi:hypothetical protein